ARFSSLCEMGESTGPGRKSAQPSRNFLGGQVPVDLAILTADFAGVGSFSWLRHRLNLASDIAGNRSYQQFGPDFSQAIVNILRGFAPSDGSRLQGEDRAGVEPGIHFHDGHAGFGIAVQDGPLDGSSPAIFWKEGGMDVE